MTENRVARGVERIPVFKPLLREEETAAATEALADGWLGMGSSVGRFEQALARLVDAGDRHVVAVSTGHAALHLALLLAEAGPGDEVITPSFNNIADLQAIIATGAEPVFCDVDEESLCIDVAKAEAMISNRTRAIIVMDYASSLCDHEGIAALATRHGVRIVHDAAHSLGSRYEESSIGSFSDLCVFSFDPVKTVTCIDGGALVVRTDTERDVLHEMRLIGMGQPASVMYENRRAWTYDVTRLGFRYHMANLHAAIGLRQVAAFDEIGSSRRTVHQRYNTAFGAISWMQTPSVISDDIVPFAYYVRVLHGRREALREHLAERGIETGIHWQPGHWFSRFRACRRDDLSMTERIAGEILTLPLHPLMDEDDVDRVIAAIGSFDPSASAPATASSVIEANRQPQRAHGQDAIGRLFRIGAEGAPVRLPILGAKTTVAFLRALPTGDRETLVRDAALLTAWRRREMHHFGSRFEPTAERTARWLSDSYQGRTDRVLFMIETEHGVPLGHIGMCGIDARARCGELDNMIRGEPGIVPGVMRLAERAVLAWAFDALGLEVITGRVLSNNFRTLAHHGRLGFRVVGHTALERIDDADGWRWEERPHLPSENGELVMTHIELTKYDRMPTAAQLDLGDRDEGHREDVQEAETILETAP